MTHSSRRLSCYATFVAAGVFASFLVIAPDASAQRGGYGAMRAYQRVAQQQMQFMQKQMQAMQKQQKEEYDAFMKRFDTNKNGKIDGKEKGPAQKYLRKLEMGVDPDKSMKTLGRTSATSSSSRSKPTKK